MKHIKIYIAFFLLVFTASDTTAQTAASELDKVSQSYLSAEHLSMEANVYVYSSKIDVAGSFLGKGVMRKSKNNYYSRFLDDEVIINSRCMLIIDHSRKTIELYDAVKSRKKNATQHLPDVKAIMASNDSVKYHGVRSGMKHFTFYNKRASVVKTELYVNAATGFIEKIEYYYSQSNVEESYDAYKVVIEYQGISVKNPGEEPFSEKKYVSRKGSNMILAPSYKNYQLIAEDKQKI